MLRLTFLHALFVLLIVSPLMGQVNWCNLQFPSSGINPQNFYARVYAAGYTDQSMVSGHASIKAWIGISSSNTNPNTWTNWTEATFNTAIGNDDEYVAFMGTNLPVGTYYIASRFQLDNSEYRYGGLAGFWNGTNSNSAVLDIYDPVYTNQSPTDISLSLESIAENVEVGSSIGTFTSADPNSNNTFTYSLVSGTGDSDNGSFSIDGSVLEISVSPDFEQKSSYSIRVRTTDQGSLSFEKSFTIQISNVNEAPADISLSTQTIAEEVEAGSTVGTLSSTDVDASNTFTYSLVAGTGDSDNGSFSIDGSVLEISVSPDFEQKSSYSIRVRTTDQGSLSFEKSFTIEIQDLDEPLGIFNTRNEVVIFPNPVSDVLTVRLNKDVSAYVNFSVLDLKGNLVMKGSFNSTELDVKGLSPGAYLLNLSDQNESHHVYKFILK